MTRIITFFVLMFVLGFLLGTLVKFALAWQNPSGSPPSGGGNSIQYDSGTSKVTIPGAGGLTVSGGNLLVSGSNRIGINQSSPADPLHVSGNIRIGDSGAPKGINLFDVNGGAAYCLRVATATIGIVSGLCSF